MKSDNHHFAIRTSKSLVKKLRYVADYNGRSGNKEIEKLIKQHVDEFERTHGKIEFNDK